MLCLRARASHLRASCAWDRGRSARPHRAPGIVSVPPARIVRLEARASRPRCLLVEGKMPALPGEHVPLRVNPYVNHVLHRNGGCLLILHSIVDHQQRHIILNIMSIGIDAKLFQQVRQDSLGTLLEGSLGQHLLNALKAKQ